MKRITFIFAALTVACLLQAQQTDVKKRFVATSEKEMYELCELMTDSTIRAKTDYSYMYMHENERFGASLSYLKRIDNTDTLMMFVQNCGYPMFIDPNFVLTFTSLISHIVCLSLFMHGFWIIWKR
jgi:hypothetical protein